MRPLRIGCGAGYSGDRIEPAVELAEKGELDYLVFECLAERTIALAQQAKASDPGAGFDPLLDERMEAVLAPCKARGIRIVTNMGAANPVAGAALRARGRARARASRAQDRGRHRRRRAAPRSARGRSAALETGEPARARRRVVSANAYLGAEPIVEALARGADVVITGRVADPSLFVAPLVAQLGWAAGRLGPARAGERSSATCSSAPARSRAATSRTPASRTWPVSRGSDSRSPRSSRTARAVITKVAGLRRARHARRPARSSCSTRSTTRPPTSRPTSSPTSAEVRVAEVGADRVRVDGATGRPRPAHAQGVGRLPRRLHRRGPDLVRGPRRGRARDGSRARSSASACALIGVAAARAHAST